MTDSINRSTANEEAARAAQQAQLKKTKQTDKATQFGAQNKALQDKTNKSAFDDMLNKMSEPENPMAASQENKFDSKIKEYSRDSEHSSSDQDAEDDAKPKDKADTGKKSKDSQLETHERVIAKHQSGEGQQDGGGGGGGKSGDESKGGQSGERSFQQKSLAGQNSQADMKKQPQQPAPAPAPDASQLQATNLQGVENVDAPQKLPKAVLDQIVQYVRIGMNKDLNKEIQIDFNDKVFNGLRLKVVSHGSEVSVEFIVPNREVRSTFSKERENIALALGEKGVDVRDILVTMR